MMKYKGYTASVEFDDEALIFHGEISGLNDVITFQAKDAKSLITSFQDSIEDYLDWCTERNKDPEKPYSGNFPVRGTPDFHKKVLQAASANGKGLNAWVVDQLDKCANNALRDTIAVKSK
jgi:predicted HicB family RNase H-like nuclease